MERVSNRLKKMLPFPASGAELMVDAAFSCKDEYGCRAVASLSLLGPKAAGDEVSFQLPHCPVMAGCNRRPRKPCGHASREWAEWRLRP